MYFYTTILISLNLPHVNSSLQLLLLSERLLITYGGCAAEAKSQSEFNKRASL